MKLEKSSIKKILLISLSNFGDVILTFPVIDILREEFRSAELSIVTSLKAQEFFSDNPHISKTYIFDKHQLPLRQFLWVLELRRSKFDLVVDLRNTAIPILVGARYHTHLWKTPTKNVHMKDKHLNRLKSIVPFFQPASKRFALHVDEENKEYVNRFLSGEIDDGKKLIVVAPGAANHIKRWTQDGFAYVCDRLIEQKNSIIVFIGDDNDGGTVQDIIQKMKHSSIDLSGKTTLLQFADVIGLADLVIANDSAIMHMASYLDKPTLAIFGPTDPKKYGPWGKVSCVIKEDIFCAPCEKSGCAYKHECMKNIKPQQVLDSAASLLERLSKK